MHVHFTYAGGTIGMVDSPHGLRPGADLEAWLADLLTVFPAAAHMPAHPCGTGRSTPNRADTQPLYRSLTTLQPPIDSAQAAPQTWQSIVDDLHAHEDVADAFVADAFVVLHGTDTMAYTASALSYALTELQQPVIVTGSQLPLGASGADAAANVVGALQALTRGAPRGVHLFFGGRLLAGNRATKLSTWSLAGFDSPSAAPLALAGAPWHWSEQADTATASGAGWTAPAPFGQHDVIVVDAVPGLSATRLTQLLTPPPVAVVLRAFGVGNLPEALTPAIAQAVAAGVAVVVSSQCLQGEVELGRYAAGAGSAAAGAVGSGDMTLEATYAKLQFLASQGLRGAELSAWVGRNLAGELTAKK